MSFFYAPFNPEQPSPPEVPATEFVKQILLDVVEEKLREFGNRLDNTLLDDATKVVEESQASFLLDDRHAIVITGLSRFVNTDETQEYVYIENPASYPLATITVYKIPEGAEVDEEKIYHYKIRQSPEGLRVACEDDERYGDSSIRVEGMAGRFVRVNNSPTDEETLPNVEEAPKQEVYDLIHDLDIAEYDPINAIWDDDASDDF